MEYADHFPRWNDGGKNQRVDHIWLEIFCQRQVGFFRPRGFGRVLHELVSVPLRSGLSQVGRIFQLAATVVNQLHLAVVSHAQRAQSFSAFWTDSLLPASHGREGGSLHRFDGCG